MPKPATLVTDLAHLPTVLVEHLVKLERWCIWRWEERVNAKGVSYWTKTPYQARFPQHKAKTDDPYTWAKYDDAVAAVANADVDGIGFMLKPGDFGAVDIDKVRDITTGAIVGWAQRLVEEAQHLSLYVENTVSGTGLRLIGLAPKGDELHRRFTFNRQTNSGIELYRRCARYITISGMQFISCQTLGSIDNYLDELEKRFDPRPSTRTYFNFNFTSARQCNDYYRDLIENGPAPGNNRSDLFQSAVWHLAANGWTADEIADEFDKYPNGIGLKYVGRLLSEVQRSFSKWQAQRQAQVTGTAIPPTSNNAFFPVILVVPSELPRVINEAENALLALGREIYQRGGMIVRPVLNQTLKASDSRQTASWQLLPVSQAHLVEVLCRAAQFQKYDKRSNKFVPIDAPDKVAEAYLNRQGFWKLPRLAGVTNTPFLRADGSICETAGYDAASYLLFKPEEQVYPPLLRFPSKGDAIVALERLRNLISTFPFITAADRAVMLVAILTALDRRTLTTAPLFGFTAPMAGTGKSLLVDLISILATGRLMPVISQGKDENEFEKRLGASLLAGDACISIDNCDHPLSGTMLCQALTQSELNIRLLGYSRNIVTVMNATIYATGNNLEIVGELIRRCLLCSLDAGVERPELRSFAINVIEQARKARSELVVAALTILRAWHVARFAGEKLPKPVAPLGNFEDWSIRVRDALIWLGEDDPCKTQEEIRKSDPVADTLNLVMEQWKLCFKIGTEHSVRDIIARAVINTDFYNALLMVAANKGGALISHERLGRWLKRNQNQIVQGFKLQRGKVSYGYQTYKLVQN